MGDETDVDIGDKLLPCSFKFHNFTIKAGDATVNCEIIKMENCLYLWIGDCVNRTMDDLSLALMLDVTSNTVATKIMGATADPTSTNIADRLSRKLKKPVFVSYNVTASNLTSLAIEKGIQEELKTHANLLNF